MDSPENNTHKRTLLLNKAFLFQHFMIYYIFCTEFVFFWWWFVYSVYPLKKKTQKNEKLNCYLINHKNNLYLITKKNFLKNR